MSVDRHLLQSQQQAPHASAPDKPAAPECEAQLPTVDTEDPETDEAPLFGTSESEDDVGDGDVLNSGWAQPQRRALQEESAQKRPSPTPEPVVWEAARVSVPARALPPARFASTRTEPRGDPAKPGTNGSDDSPTTFDEEVHLRARLNTRGGLAAAGATGLTRRARKQRRLESLVGDARDERTSISSTPSSPLQADSSARESPSDQNHDREGVSNPPSASEEAMQSVAAPTSHSSTAQSSPGVSGSALNEMSVAPASRICAPKGTAEASRPNRQLSIVSIGNEDATSTSAAQRSSQAVVPTQPFIRHRVTTTQLFNFLHAQQHSEPSVVHSPLPSQRPVASAASTHSPAASSQIDILDAAESHLNDAQKAELRRQTSMREKWLLDSHIRAAQARHEQILHSLLRTKVDQHVLQSGAKIVKERIAKLLGDTKYKPMTSLDGKAAHEHQASGETARTKSGMSPGEPQDHGGKDRASGTQASVQNPLLPPSRVMQHGGSTSIQQDASTTASSGSRREVPRDEAGSSDPNLTRVISAPDELDTVESYFLSKENSGGEASLTEAGRPERDDTYAQNLHALNLRPEDLWIPPSLEEALASISRNVWEDDLNDLGAFESTS
ncbi:hypothetical protein CBOM_05923 [Ceraceosorus bombacis]|uniref:Uncharacterized protein n=1 Tax=Ceraceosorus bombacis TaxID=401625 RepID=A0A0P1BIF7_9BASI|nr:hypothetical protein CBOM_05923 [Ceraceosorus bombacis]